MNVTSSRARNHRSIWHRNTWTSNLLYISSLCRWWCFAFFKCSGKNSAETLGNFVSFFFIIPLLLFISVRVFFSYTFFSVDLCARSAFEFVGLLALAVAVCYLNRFLSSLLLALWSLCFFSSLFSPSPLLCASVSREMRSTIASFHVFSRLISLDWEKIFSHSSGKSWSSREWFVRWLFYLIPVMI